MSLEFLAQTPARQSAISSTRTESWFDSVLLDAALLAALDLAEDAELVLDVVADLVGDDVGVGEVALHAELLLHLLEERGVEIDLLVERAVERPHRGLGRAAAAAGAAGVEHHARSGGTGARSGSAGSPSRRPRCCRGSRRRSGRSRRSAWSCAGPASADRPAVPGAGARRPIICSAPPIRIAGLMPVTQPMMHRMTMVPMPRPPAPPPGKPNRHRRRPRRAGPRHCRKCGNLPSASISSHPVPDARPGTRPREVSRGRGVRFRLSAAPSRLRPCRRGRARRVRKSRQARRFCRGWRSR